MTVILDSPFEYVADPDCRTFTHGVRWEGIKKRARIIDLKMNPRYDKAALAKLKPNCQPSKEVLRANPAMPSDFQMVEYYEIYDHRSRVPLRRRRVDDDRSGSGVDARASCESLRRSRVRGRRIQRGRLRSRKRIFALSADGFRFVERALVRLPRHSLPRASADPEGPYSTLVLDKDAQISKDEIEAVLESSGPGIVAIPMDGKNIQQVMQRTEHEAGVAGIHQLPAVRA